MKAALSPILIAGAAGLCLGPTHSTFVQGFAEKTVDQHHARPEEFKQAEAFKLWFDLPSGKSLVHAHEDNSQGQASGGMLTDYNKGLTWRWDFDQRQGVQNCELKKVTYPQETYCFGKANFTDHADSGTIGEHYKIDHYIGHLTDHEKHINEQVDVLVEAGSDAKNVLPIEQESRITAQGEQHEEVHAYQRKSFYDFSTARIPATTFTVPKECPN